jgi:hypothetical protein
VNIELSAKELTISVPFGLPIVLINNNLEYSKFEMFTKPESKYNQLLDVIPFRSAYLNNSVEVYDLYGKLLSCQLMKLESKNFIVSNYTYLLSYFLANYYFAESNNKVYLSYYYSMLTLMEIDSIANKNIFNYSISTFGLDNYNEPYFYYLKNLKNNYDTKNNITDKPKSSHLVHPKCDSNVEFDYGTSEFFQIDGKLNNNIEFTNYSRYISLFEKK